MTFDHVATVLFALAVLHTFMAGKFNSLASKYPRGSIRESVYHFLGEIEVVFGMWLIPLFYAYWAYNSWDATLDYFNSVAPKMIEPLFVVVVMVKAATKPVLDATRRAILSLSRIVPLPSETARYYATILIIAPIIGSFITEPAAMTIAALLLAQLFYEKNPSTVLKYATIALLFVNISIGGTLTHFAAPPVLMVAAKWGWNQDIMFMLSNFGWKSVVSIVLCTLAVVMIFRRQFRELDAVQVKAEAADPIPAWVTVIHFLSLGWAVLMAHQAVLLVLGFMFFLGFVVITQKYQDGVNVKPALLVGFFLAGLVIHGNLQEWWITPIIQQLSALPLFISSMVLTAFNDNAAITYLSSLALEPGLAQAGSEQALKKYAIVAGAVGGGGLTIIANAPNPAGNSILKPYFGEEGVNPLKLALYALPFTVVAALCLYLL